MVGAKLRLIAVESRPLHFWIWDLGSGRDNSNTQMHPSNDSSQIFDSKKTRDNKDPKRFSLILLTPVIKFRAPSPLNTPIPPRSSLNETGGAGSLPLHSCGCESIRQRGTGRGEPVFCCLILEESWHHVYSGLGIMCVGGKRNPPRLQTQPLLTKYTTPSSPQQPSATPSNPEP